MGYLEGKFIELPLRLAIRRIRGHFVYVLWRENEPVYVGVTSGLVDRINQHRCKMSREDDYSYDSVTVKRFRNRTLAESEEARLIRLLNPEYNTQGRDEASFIDLMAALGLEEPIEGLRRI